MIRDLVVKLKNRAYRNAFADAHVRNGIAFQIKAMRNARGWDQKKLATVLGNEKLQPVISRYENPDYGRYSLATLLELARAFDVALIVRFGRFSDLLRWDSQISQQNLNVPSFEQELGEIEAAPAPKVLRSIAAAAEPEKATLSELTSTIWIPKITIEGATTAAIAPWNGAKKTPDAPRLGHEDKFSFLPWMLTNAANQAQTGA